MTAAIKEKIQDILRDSGAYDCVECGKCVAVCPMQEMYTGFSFEMSPRGVIKQSLFEPDILSNHDLWYCTQCNACTDICPEGVSCRDLVRGLREVALARGLSEKARTCSACGALYSAVPVMTYVKEKLRDRVSPYLDLCPACRRQAYLRRNA